MKNIGGNQKCPLVYIKFKNRNESNKKQMQIHLCTLQDECILNQGILETICNLTYSVSIKVGFIQVNL